MFHSHLMNEAQYCKKVCLIDVKVFEWISNSNAKSTARGGYEYFELRVLLSLVFLVCVQSRGKRYNNTGDVDPSRMGRPALQSLLTNTQLMMFWNMYSKIKQHAV